VLDQTTRNNMANTPGAVESAAPIAYEARAAGVSSTSADSPTLPQSDDIVSHRIVVGCLGAVVVLTVLAFSVLGFLGREIPQALAMTGTGALGALTGVLVRPPK
jgi:hypothetical protein